MVKLRNPNVCRFCGETGKVIDTRMGDGFRWRRRQCSTCTVEHKDGPKPYRWNTFETTIDPREIFYKVRQTAN